MFAENELGLGAGLVHGLKREAFTDFGDSNFGVVGECDEADIVRADGAGGDEAILDEGHHGCPELDAHQHDGKVENFASLDERCDLEEFVEGAKAAGQCYSWLPYRRSHVR